MNEQRFRYGWKLICEMWHSKNNHCLRYGCGRISLQYWMTSTCHVYESPWFWRTVMMEGVKRGWAVKSKSKSGHSVFIIKC